jgi:glycosyltransferase involved in cell wall biosynthesis
MGTQMNHPRPEIVSERKLSSIMPQVALPKVSVIVTCFNYARYAGQALDSVASQSYKCFDCVAVDDCSTDDSASVIEQWISDRKDPRFRLIRNNSNSGQTASLSTGLTATNGEFVAFLDADDFWFPEFIERHVEAHLNRCFTVSVSCSDLVQINDEGRVLSGTVVGGPIIKADNSALISSVHANYSAHIDENRTLEFSEAPAIHYIAPGYLANRTVTSGMMFRRSMLNLIMPDEPTELRICTDNYAFVICHYFTGSLAICSAFGAYRRHGKNNFVASSVMGRNQPCAPATTKYYEKKIISVMLRHLLDKYERFATEFSEESVRRLARILFRRWLDYDGSIPDARLRRVIGVRQMLVDRAKMKVSRLRRIFSRIVAVRAN